MREKLEMLSAMVDDELDIPSQETLTDALLASAALKGAWRRYNLFGEVLREEYGREHVSRGSAQEAAVWQRGQPAPRMRLVPIAATMLLTVIGTVTVTNLVWREPAQLSSGEVIANGSDTADSVASPEELRSIVAEFPAVRRSQFESDPQSANAKPVAMVRYEDAQPMQHDERLDSYIVNFNEQRVNQGMPGTYPYVRIVGYDAGQ